MKTSICLLTLILLGSIDHRVVRAGDCVCAMVPMYPVDNMGNWFHYAVVRNSANCAEKYQTGHIDQASTAETCQISPLCGQCTALGIGGAVSPLFYGASGSSPVTYADLDTPGKVRQFLKNNMPPGANPAIFDKLNYSIPLPSAYVRPFIVKLQRKNGSAVEKFNAIVWKTAHVVKPGTISYTGIEIAGPYPPDVAVLNQVMQCNAVSTESNGNGGVKHVPIPGLLAVQFSSLGEDIAFVRLHNSPISTGATFPPCK